MADSTNPTQGVRPTNTKSLPLKPIEGHRVGALWENDQRLLFDMAAKINDIIAVVNDMVATDKEASNG